MKYENDIDKARFSKLQNEFNAMLQALTISDVRAWDFIGTTPAYREHYYNKELDVAAYISGNVKIQFYFNRRVDGEKYAACFSDNLIVDLAS